MSYGRPGAWDGGPPGAEAEYVNSVPATDPWTGAHYYDYRYSYPTYYPLPTTSEQYYAANYTNPDAQHSNYNYQGEGSNPPDDHQRRTNCRQTTRSPSYDKEDDEQDTRRKRSSSYEDHIEKRLCRSRKYSSSDRSSYRSRSRDKDDKRRSYSSASSSSSKSNNSKYRRKDRSLSPQYKGRNSWSFGKERSRRSPLQRDSKRRRSPHTPSVTPEKERLKKDKKSHSSNQSNDNNKKRKSARSITPYKRSEKSHSKTPPRSKQKRSRSQHQKERSRSISPPESYLPHRSRSTSKDSEVSLSRSESDRSMTPQRRSKSSSPERRSRSRSKRRKSKSRSRSKSKRRRRRSNSRSRSKSPRRRSRSRSEDERRGQFTVSDRKRYWKLHRSRQGDKAENKTSEPKPPPGAMETITADDIEYGDPPELVGPNFAELPLGSTEDYYKASTSKKVLPIKNDGSFLQMFKKMQEIAKKEEDAKKTEIKKPALPFIGKRRGGRVLKTGVVKKAKAIDEQPADGSSKDAWSLYMQEVKKYKETSCEDDRKTRLLVK